MQSFLVKLINYTIENEKKFDTNRLKMTALNELLYEYEKLSSEAYIIDFEKIQGSNH